MSSREPSLPSASGLKRPSTEVLPPLQEPLAHSELEMLVYIAAMLTELSALSRLMPQPVLSYLLEMAREEARRCTRQ